jgi:hypothetical protein
LAPSSDVDAYRAAQARAVAARMDLIFILTS